MNKRFALTLAVLFVPLSARAGKVDLEKLGEKCRAGSVKECNQLSMIAADSNETEEVRLGAVERMNDQATLANIVASPASLTIRERALGRLQDQKRLGAIAKESKEWGLRKAAVEKLTDPAVLEDVAATASESYVVYAAIARIDDPAVLVRLARGEEVGTGMARALAQRIDDPAVITDLALTTRGSMRDEARARCTDSRALGTLVKKDLKYRAATTGRDMAKITDQAVLADLAESAHPWETRRDAVQRLRDRAALARIAKSDESEEVRALAVRRGAAVARGLGATGTLVEASVGRPLAHFNVALGSYGTMPVAVATTDADGRFLLEGLEAGKWSLMHLDSPLRGASDEITVQVARAGRSDLGKLAVQDDDLVTREFGSLCDAQGAPSRVPEGALVVFTQEPRGWRHRYAKLNQFGWTPPWKAALCIKEGGELVGTYVTKDGTDVGNAYATKWTVRAIRLSDGQTFAGTFTADPPKTTTARRVGDGAFHAYGSGDPSAAFLAWLKDLR
jgi:hypothetical protein